MVPYLLHIFNLWQISHGILVVAKVGIFLFKTPTKIIISLYASVETIHAIHYLLMGPFLLHLASLEELVLLLQQV